MIGVYCTSTWPVNKQVLAFTLFVRNSSRHVHDDCSMKKQSISTAVVKMNYKIMLKLWRVSIWMYASLSLWSVHFLYFTLSVCSTVRHTVFVLFASQLTAAPPFSMRTSSITHDMLCYITHDMLCYITHDMLRYITNVMLGLGLYNTCYVMLYNTWYVMLGLGLALYNTWYVVIYHMIFYVL